MPAAMTREVILDSIFRYVGEYIERFNKPVKLQYITRLYGKRLVALGELSVREVLDSDSRFRTVLKESGGTEVMLRGTEPLLPSELVVALLSKYEGKMSLVELKANLEASGHSPGNIETCLNRMLSEAEAYVDESDVFRLLVY